jgi:hypothetical protein
MPEDDSDEGCVLCRRFGCDNKGPVRAGATEPETLIGKGFSPPCVGRTWGADRTDHSASLSQALKRGWTRVSSGQPGVEPPAGIEPATHPYHSCCHAPVIEGAQVKWPGVSVADRGEPVASCSEWHGDGTAGENDRSSSLAATVPAREMVRPVQGDTSRVGKPPLGGAAALDSTRSLDR